MALKRLAEDYFKNLNSISNRLHYDLEEVKSSYEDLWTSIPEKEQKTILSESIIKPEISIKYNNLGSKTNNKFGLKMIFDENYSYRDEHSGPFSFKSQSQRDLSIFRKEELNFVPENKSSLKPKTQLVQAKPILMYKERDIRHTSDGSDSEATNSLPITGLDFLDNW